MVEAEQAIMELVRRHNFPAIILRVGSVYGRGRDFVDSVASGTATMIGDGRNYLSHIHIDDLVFLLEQIALQGQPGALYNLADDEPTRAQDFYGEIRLRLGMVPPRAFSKERSLLSGMDPSVVGMASSSTRLSNQRAKQELNLTLRYPSFRTWLDERLLERDLAEHVLAVCGL
jgi:nucleoside-diphosphate-sugar epimerase